MSSLANMSMPHACNSTYLGCWSRKVWVFLFLMRCWPPAQEGKGNRSCELVRNNYWVSASERQLVYWSNNRASLYSPGVGEDKRTRMGIHLICLCRLNRRLTNVNYSFIQIQEYTKRRKETYMLSHSVCMELCAVILQIRSGIWA